MFRTCFQRFTLHEIRFTLCCVSRGTRFRAISQRIVMNHARYERRTVHQFRSHFDRMSLYPSHAASSTPNNGTATVRINC